MELLANGPAALGGIMMSVALGAWSLGRWQGGLAASDDAAPAVPSASGAGGEGPVADAPRHDTGTASCRDAAQAGRRSALAVADSLGELHAEISAYRRAEQVLAGPEAGGLRLRLYSADERSTCRHLGLMGEPTCGVAGPARTACAGGTRCSTADPLPAPAPALGGRLPQPSPTTGLTRV